MVTSYSDVNIAHRGCRHSPRKARVGSETPAAGSRIPENAKRRERQKPKLSCVVLGCIILRRLHEDAAADGSSTATCGAQLGVEQSAPEWLTSSIQLRLVPSTSADDDQYGGDSPRWPTVLRLVQLDVGSSRPDSDCGLRPRQAHSWHAPTFTIALRSGAGGIVTSRMVFRLPGC